MSMKNTSIDGEGRMNSGFGRSGKIKFFGNCAAVAIANA